jgi:hypothetical protein
VFVGLKFNPTNKKKKTPPIKEATDCSEQLTLPIYTVNKGAIEKNHAIEQQ